MDENIVSTGENNPSFPLIEKVYEGMQVVDSQGEKIGKVEAVKMGDPQAVTTTGEGLEKGGLFHQVVTSIFGPEIKLPQSLRDNLLRSGFIKIDGTDLLDTDRFVPANKIASVTNDTVRLSVPKGRIAEEQF